MKERDKGRCEGKEDERSRWKGNAKRKDMKGGNEGNNEAEEAVKRDEKRWKEGRGQRPKIKVK